MSYMIFENGNAIDAFDDLDAARDAFRALVNADPSAAGDLALLAFDVNGIAVGEAEVAADIVPDSVTTVTLTSAVYEWMKFAVATFIPVYRPVAPPASAGERSRNVGSQSLTAA